MRVLAAIAAFIAVAFLLRQTHHTYPVSDLAVLELYTLHAIRGHQLLGPYSQYGWNHPGPLLFYAFAPLYLASGEKFLSLNVTAWLLNVSSLALVLWIILTHIPVRARLAMLATLAIYVFRVRDMLVSPWNPHVLVMPLLAMLFCAGALASGRWWMLLPLVIGGSFVAQTHVGLVPVTLTLAIFAAAIVAMSLRPARWEDASASVNASANANANANTNTNAARWIGGATLVLMLLWIPPIAQQLTTPNGNLSQLYAFFVTNRSPRVGLADGLFVWADLVTAMFHRTLAVPVGWNMKPASSAIAPIAALAQLALLAVAAWWYRRPEVRVLAAFCAIGVMTSLVALWSIAQIRGVLLDHAVFWITAIGAANWSLLAAFACDIMPFASLAPLDGPRAARLALLTGLTLAIALAGSGAMTLMRMATGATHDRPLPVERVGNAVAAKSLSSRSPAMCRIDQQVWSEAAGIVLQAWKRGAAITIEPDWISMFGPPLASTGREQAILRFMPANAPLPPGGTVWGCTPSTCAVLEP